MLLTHAFALSASQFVHKKKSLRIYTSMLSGGLELTKLTCNRHEDNLLRHRRDRLNLARQMTTAVMEPASINWSFRRPLLARAPVTKMRFATV